MEVQHERDILRKRIEEINKHYNRLYEESKYLIYSLERKQHDLNHLNIKLASALGGDNPDEILQMEMNRLQNDLAKLKKENDKIQKMWVEEREDNLKLKSRYQALQSEKDHLMVTRMHY